MRSVTGRCRDSIRTGRFFRILKYEDMYIKEYNGTAELRSGVMIISRITALLASISHWVAGLRLRVTLKVQIHQLPLMKNELKMNCLEMGRIRIILIPNPQERIMKWKIRAMEGEREARISL